MHPGPRHAGRSCRTTASIDVFEAVAWTGAQAARARPSPRAASRGTSVSAQASGSSQCHAATCTAPSGKTEPTKGCSSTAARAAMPPQSAARLEPPIHQASNGSARASSATGDARPPAAAMTPARARPPAASATWAASAILPDAATSKAANQQRPKAAKIVATVTAAPMPEVTSVTAAPAAKNGAASMMPMKRRWRRRSSWLDDGPDGPCVRNWPPARQAVQRYLAVIKLNSTHSHPVVTAPALQVAFVDLKLASSV